MTNRPWLEKTIARAIYDMNLEYAKDRTNESDPDSAFIKAKELLDQKLVGFTLVRIEADTVPANNGYRTVFTFVVNDAETNIELALKLIVDLRAGRVFTTDRFGNRGRFFYDIDLGGLQTWGTSDRGRA